MFRARWMLSTFFAVLICQHAAAQSYQKIYADFRNIPLAQALETLVNEHHLACNFADHVVADIQINKQIPGMVDSIALDFLLMGTGLSYETMIVEGTKAYLIVPKKWGTIHLHGKVLNQETGEPLAGTAVIVLDEQGGYEIENHQFKYGTYTDSLGKFTVSFQPEAGTSLIQLMVRRMDHESQVIEVELPPDGFLDIRLTISSNSRFGVSIEEKINPSIQQIEQPELNFGIQLSPEQLKNHRSTGESDVMRSAQLVPGVQSINESASELFIRGGAPEHNLVLLDGIPVLQSGHFFGMVGLFNSRAVEDVQILRGGFDVRHGGRLSSVINITGKPNHPEKKEYGAGMNALSANAFFETPIQIGRKKGGILIAGRRSTTDLIATPLYQNFFEQVFSAGTIGKDYERQATVNGPDMKLTPRLLFGDLNAKFMVDLSDQDRLAMSLFGSHDRLNYENRSQLDRELLEVYTDQLTQSSYGGSLNWQRKWNQAYQTETQLTYSDYAQTHVYQSSTLPDSGFAYQLDFRFRQSIQDLNLKQHHRWELNEAHTTEGGVELNQITLQKRESVFDVGLQDMDSLELLDTQELNTAYLASAYLQESYASAASPFSLRMGVRYTYYSKNNRGYLAPRVATKYQLSDAISLNASWGRYRQFLQRMTISNSLQVGQNFWMLADGDSIPVAQADHLITGISYASGDWLAEVELYHKSLSDISTYSLVEDPNAGTLIAQHLLTGGFGTAKGLDVFLKRRLPFRKSQGASWGSMDVGMAYSLSEVTYSFAQINKSAPFFADHDQRHILKLFQEMNLSRWNVTTSWVYASGRPFTEAVEIGPTLDDSHSRGQLFLEYGNRNAARLPAYHRLDVSVAYKFSLLSSTRQSDIGISVFNVYNRRNVQSRQFFGRSVSNGNEIVHEISSVDRMLLGFSPNLFLNLHF
ncbi:MAG: TonB-dependent receptor [Bacteroidota bacterium]